MLEQFTGLRDKNGEDIYEGDICRFHTGVMVIQWSRCGFVASPVVWNGDPGSIYWQWHSTFKRVYGKDRNLVEEINENEILGNVHENPELLNPTP